MCILSQFVSSLLIINLDVSFPFHCLNCRNRQLLNKCSGECSFEFPKIPNCTVIKNLAAYSRECSLDMNQWQRLWMETRSSRKINSQTSCSPSFSSVFPSETWRMSWWSAGWLEHQKYSLEQFLKNQETIFHFCFNLKALEGRGGAALPVVFTQTEVEGGWHCKEHASPSGGSQYEKAADP